MRLHVIKRSATTWRASAYAPVTSFPVPAALVGKIKRLLMPDRMAEVGTLSRDISPIVTTQPSNVSDHFVPFQIARAYGVSTLYARGYKGSGMTIGVVGATLFKVSDVQSMWRTFGITRQNPTVVETMEPIITRDLETTLDIELAGAIAPSAALIYYGGPNNSDTSLLYTFNYAVGAAQVQVITDSFAHAEATTPYPVARAYDESAMMAAALGITVLSASGDSSQVDVPANSPYVTAVGGTNIELTADNFWESERSWGLSGCGRSRLFALPAWQIGEFSDSRGARTVADVGLVVGLVVGPYWVKYLGKWTYADGTSASAPVFAALLSVVNQARAASGKPPVGFLNPLLYKHAATRAAFRDIKEMGYGGCATGSGYDMATGIGSPKAATLSTAIP
jgi:kumamolisin